MLVRFRMAMSAAAASLVLLGANLLLAQNTAPVPTTFKIVTPDDGNAASLINSDYSVNHKVFYGGDFAYRGANNNLGFKGYTVGGDPNTNRKARGNDSGSRLTLGGTEYGADSTFPAYGLASVASLGAFAPVTGWPTNSFDTDDLGGNGSYPNYTGANGFIAINEGDTLEIDITGFIDPNNKMVTSYDAGAADGNYTGRNFMSQDGNGTAGNDGANNVTYEILNKPAGASFTAAGQFRWVPSFVQGDGGTDDSQHGGLWFIDANISNGTTTSETTAGNETGAVGYALGELKDSLYVIYFKAVDDGTGGNNSAMDSLFILVNDSLPNPSPRFTRRTLLRKDSLGIQQTKTYNYLLGQPDTLWSVFEGDSIIVTIYAEDQDSLQGETNDIIGFGMLGGGTLLGVSKGSTSADRIAGFNQFIKRAGTVDTLLADTTSTVSGNGTATSIRIRLQIPFNLAASVEKADTLVVMVSDGTTIKADTFALKVRNKNRSPIWDADSSSTPSDSTLVYSSNPATSQPDSVQTVQPFTLNNGQTDSTYFSRYVYDPDFLIGDSLGNPLTFTHGGNHQGTLNANTGLNVFTPNVSDTVTYSFTITASDSYTSDPKSTQQTILFRVAPAPVISEVDPASGSINHQFTIYGSGFGLFNKSGPDSSQVVFYATTNGVRLNIRANIIAWSKNQIVATVPSGVPPAKLDSTQSYLVADTILVKTAIYGGFTTFPFTVLVDSAGFENLEVVSITSTSATIRYRTNFTGADSVVLASVSDTLDIHAGGGSYSVPTFVENDNGTMTQIPATVQVFHDETAFTDGVHVIQLTDLLPSTVYRFFIGSSNGIYVADSLRNENGPYRPKKIDIATVANNSRLDAFRLHTLSSTGSSSNLFSVQGKVYYSGGAATDAAVTVRLVKSDDPADTSLPIVTTVASDSTWVLELGNLKKSDGSSFNHAQGDYMLFDFDGAEKGFQQLQVTRAASGQTQVVANAKLVPLVEFNLLLKTGLNLIGPPLKLNRGEPSTAHAFLSEISGGTPSITRYVSSTATQESITRSAQGTFIGASDFSLVVNQGYFVEVSSETKVKLNGTAYTSQLGTVNFAAAGLNFISLPGMDNQLFYPWDAQSILQNVVSATEIIRFNSQLQNYETFLKNGTTFIGPNNFSFQAGEGYILRVTAATSWNPNGPTLLLASTNDGDAAGNDVPGAIVIDLAGMEDGKASAAVVKVTDISSSAAVLSWMTGSADPGRIRLSRKDAAGELVITSAPNKLAFGMSYAQVTGLKPETEYVYRLENSSGALVQGNAEGSFTTAPIGTGMVPYSLYGRLVDTAGHPLPGMLVLIKLTRSAGNGESSYLSAISDKDGYWLVNLANLKEKGTGLVYAWQEGDKVELTVIGGAFSAVFAATVKPGSPHNIALDLQNGGQTDQNTQEKQPVSASLPKAYALAQNFPNPFNPSTTIQFSIPEGSGPVAVRLDIYNLRGQLVSTLVDRRMEPGDFRVQWTGTDGAGKQVPSGVYFYRLTTPTYEATRKMVILK